MSEESTGLPESLRARYQVLGVLGQGAMGTVLRARDRELGREVALKIIKGDITPEHIARLRREARLMARLSHPGLVEVYELAQLPSGPYIVSELVAGKPPELVLPVEAVREILDGVASALEVAHAAGVVHRDVKPSNILVDAGGRSRLIDFGLASDPADDKLTQTGCAVGTPRFMAPEILRGRPATTAADMFALGMTGYMLLEGDPPFAWRDVLKRRPLRVRWRRADVPPALRELLAACLEADPADRPRDMASFRAALARAAPPAEPRPPDPPAPAPRRGASRRSAAAMGAVGLAVGLVAGTLFRAPRPVAPPEVATSRPFPPPPAAPVPAASDRLRAALGPAALEFPAPARAPIARVVAAFEDAPPGAGCSAAREVAAAGGGDPGAEHLAIALGIPLLLEASACADPIGVRAEEFLAALRGGSAQSPGEQAAELASDPGEGLLSRVAFARARLLELILRIEEGGGAGAGRLAADLLADPARLPEAEVVAVLRRLVAAGAPGVPGWSPAALAEELAARERDLRGRTGEPGAGPG